MYQILWADAEYRRAVVLDHPHPVKIPEYAPATLARYGNSLYAYDETDERPFMSADGGPWMRDTLNRISDRGARFVFTDGAQQFGRAEPVKERFADATAVLGFLATRRKLLRNGVMLAA